MPNRKYYHAYDDRYQQIHDQGLQWFDDGASGIVEETIRSFPVSPQAKLLEIGCGEGRDAYPLLKQGFDLLVTDVSPSAIEFCQKKFPEYNERFQTLDCITEKLNCKFDFIYAVAVIHMLVTDEDRDGFYSFIRNHLSNDGIALICTMGDGSIERQTDITTAFDIQQRTHEQSGKTVYISNTSCRMISFNTFEEELNRNDLVVLQKGITAAKPDFPQMMFAVVTNG